MSTTRVAVTAMLTVLLAACPPHTLPKGPPPEYEDPPPPSWLDGGAAAPSPSPSPESAPGTTKIEAAPPTPPDAG